MKKKLLAGLLAASVLLGCVGMAWAGSSTDALVSLNYLNGTYLAGLKETVAAAGRTPLPPRLHPAPAQARGWPGRVGGAPARRMWQT
ncbi:MAG: hypothetical protein K1W21_08105, partial [Oscillospiraceae bacterium]